MLAHLGRVCPAETIKGVALKRAYGGEVWQVRAYMHAHSSLPFTILASKCTKPRGLLPFLFPSLSWLLGKRGRGERKKEKRKGGAKMAKNFLLRVRNNLDGSWWRCIHTSASIFNHEILRRATIRLLLSRLFLSLENFLVYFPFVYTYYYYCCCCFWAEFLFLYI